MLNNNGNDRINIIESYVLTKGTAVLSKNCKTVYRLKSKIAYRLNTSFLYITAYILYQYERCKQTPRMPTAQSPYNNSQGGST